MSGTAGAPGSPREMSITKTSTALTLHWSEGDIGSAPITGYVVESRPSGRLMQLFIYEYYVSLNLNDCRIDSHYSSTVKSGNTHFIKNSNNHPHYTHISVR